MNKIFVLIVSFVLSNFNIFALDTPTQSSPSDGATEQNVNVTLFINNNVSGATSYQYMLDTTMSFNSPILRTFEHSAAYSGWKPDDLYFNTTYYWKIRACNSTDTSAWSSVWTFSTVFYGATQSSPFDNAINQPVQISLMIDKYGAENYDYQLDTSQNFDSPLLQNASHSSTYSGYTFSDLFYNKTYYWRVRGRNSADTSAWSSVWSFTTALNGATNSSPANGTTDLGTSVPLYIDKLTGSENFDYQLDTSPNFDSPYLRDASHNNSYSGYTFANLDYNQTYYWHVRGRNDNDTSVWSDTWYFSTSNLGVVQSSPSNGSNNTGTKLTLWVNIKTGTHYIDYQLDTSPDFNSSYLRTATHDDNYSGYVFSDLDYNQTYYWRVRGRNDNDTSDWTSFWSFTTAEIGAEQDAPANNSTDKDVALTLWIDATAGSDSIDYLVDTTQNFNSSVLKYFTHSDNYSGWQVNNLFYNTTYYWKVRGRNDNDTSIWTNDWNFTTAQFGATPDSPIDNATNISTTPTLYVDKISGNDSLDFQIDTTNLFNSPLLAEYSISGNYSGINISNDTLRYGTTYYWRCRGRHSVDTSDWSNYYSFTTSYEMTNPILVEPVNDSINAPYSSITLVWNTLANANEYEFEVSENPDFSNTFSSGSTSLTSTSIGGLYPATTYYWRVRGENNSGFSPWSDVWHFTTASVPLDEPTLVFPANNSTNQALDIEFKWQEVYGANEYFMQISSSSDFNTYSEFNTADTVKQVTGLGQNSVYFWRVKASDGTSESNWSEIWSFQTGTGTLETPVLIAPSENENNIDTAMLIFLWYTVNDADNYDFQLSTDAAFLNIFYETNIADTTLTIEHLDCDDIYFWRVKAHSTYLESYWSPTRQFSTIPCENFIAAPNLRSPENNSQNIDNQQVTFEWSNVNQATAYNFQLSFDSNFDDLVVDSILSIENCTVDNLFCSSTYYWRVNATDGSITSDWSDVWNFTTVSCAEIDVLGQNSVRVYPNPVNNFVVITAGNASYLNIEIFDIRGQFIIEKRSTNGKLKIDLSNLNSGVYLLYINTGEDFVQKIIIKQ